MEYPKAVEELKLWNRHRIPNERKQDVASLTNKVFSITYKHNLHLFPHVRGVLEWAQDERIVVIGLSDALERWVCFRLRILGVEKYFSGLYTWHQDQWFDDRSPVKSSISKRVRLASSELKPNLAVVNEVLADFSLARETTFMVGDSLFKDIAVAQAAKVQDIWARYGTRPREDNLDTLRRITPWTESERAVEKEAGLSIEPTHVIDDFSELISLIGTRHPTLFD